MQVIVNSYFFPCNRLNKCSPEAYHKISKNVKWESINALVRRGNAIEVSPIAFISLTSCFTEQSSSKGISLADVLHHIKYPTVSKCLIVTLSSENDDTKKKSEIEKAKSKIISKFKKSKIEEFKISKQGGGYYGFIASIQ